MKGGHRSHISHRETILRGKFIRPLRMRLFRRRGKKVDESKRNLET